MILGLTGGIASGKSTVSAYLAEKGFPIADSDKISREITKKGGEGAKAIERAFGSEFFSCGELDRKKLAEYCFADVRHTKKLNSLLHPIILSQMLDFTKTAFNAGHGTVIWDVPLLFETGFESYCDKCAVVICDTETQIRRASKRSDISRQDLLNRISLQMTDSERIKKADFIIDNSGSLTETFLQTDKMLEELF